MDKQKIIQIAAQIASAAETITVAGEYNRVQLSGIYHAAAQIMAEAGKEDNNG